MPPIGTVFWGNVLTGGLAGRRPPAQGTPLLTLLGHETSCSNRAGGCASVIRHSHAMRVSTYCRKFRGEDPDRVSSDLQTSAGFVCFCYLTS
mgnify:CR=1 FL=1|jgi:hypothetical protein